MLSSTKNASSRQVRWESPWFYFRSFMLKSDWLKIENEYSAHAQKSDLARVCVLTFSFPEAAILLVCARNRDLWPLPKPEVRDSRTHFQIWQTWLAEKHRTSTLRMLRNWERPEVSIPGRRPEGSRPLRTRMAFLVLTKRKAVSEHVRDWQFSQDLASFLLAG